MVDHQHELRADSVGLFFRFKGSDQPLLDLLLFGDVVHHALQVQGHPVFVADGIGLLPDPHDPSVLGADPVLALKTSLASQHF